MITAQDMEFPEIDLEAMNKIKEETTSHELRVYLAALEYCKAGIYVIPVIRNGKKLPRKDLNVNYSTASKRKKIIDKWFHPDTGKFKGYNIGIACGKEGGMFVVDVDKKEDGDGHVHLNKLFKKHGEFPPCPVQMSPGEGSHYFFLWQDNAISSTDKIAPYIDTRGGEAGQCKSHVVAFPSMVNGKMYEWTTGGLVPDIPAWVMEKMGASWHRTRLVTEGPGRGNENIEDEDLEKPIEPPQIKSMLEAIDPNTLSYDDWLRVGLSVKSQLPGEDGLALWDSWSKRGNRYKDDECRTRWNGFSDFGTVRGGTLFYHARESGWMPDEDKGERSGNRFDELVERMNKEYAVVAIGGKIRILREKESISAWDMHYDLLEKAGFEVLLENEKVVVGKGKSAKFMPISKVWLAHEGRRTFEKGVGLFPDNKVPAGYFNTWNGFSVEPREGDCSMFLSHLKNIICGGVNEHYDWLIHWLADLVQDAGQPKGCAVVMRGGEGCGKGTFANAIGKIFGPHHRHLIDESHLTSNFNAHLLDAVTVFADEITWGGNKKSAGKLKGMVTEENLVGERKNIDAIQYKNMVHLMIASNSDWVIPSSFDSRRWFVLDVLSDRVNDVQYFREINDELNNGGLEALLYFLLNYDLDSSDANIRRAPETNALQDQRALNIEGDAVVTWWSMMLMTGDIDGKGWPEDMVKTDLYHIYEDYMINRKKNAKSMPIWAKAMVGDFMLGTTRVTVEGGGRKYAFKLPSLSECRRVFDVKYKGLLGKDYLEAEDDTAEVF